MDIKFRAIDLKSNQYVYGDLAHVKTWINKKLVTQLYIIEVHRTGGMFYATKRYRVTPESVEQFIGYRENGEEIYETVFDYNP